MPRVPLFDSLTHPMPTGDWLGPKYTGSSRADNLVAAMHANGVTSILAVGMGETVGGYVEADYVGWVTEAVPGAYPVAWCDPRVGDFERFQKLGFRGVKVHPRRCGIDFRLPALPKLISEVGMPTLLCTYGYEKGRPRAGRTLDDVLALLDQCGESPIVLLHGGVVNCLEWAEAIRPYPNVLLDLSFTLVRYAGSSIDLDIRYLFEHFDQRICVGSDHPEISLAEFRERFDALSTGLETEKAHNIAHRNLELMFGTKASG